MRMNRRRKSARISVQERLKTPGKPCAYQPRRHSGLLEQTVAHGAAGRAVSEINTVRRGPVNGGDYEVQGLQVTVATVFIIFRGYIVCWSG